MLGGDFCSILGIVAINNKLMEVIFFCPGLQE